MEGLGDRQQELLKLLLKRKEGLGAEEIADGLGITRPGVRQHLVALEKLGYVERAELVESGGRPTQTYRLTQKGYDLFPKQYSWFSEVLLEKLRVQSGAEAFGRLMEQLGTEVAQQTSSQIRGQDLKEKVEEVAKIMNDLAYQAETALTGRELPGSPPVIEASNCVFHAIAVKFPEICRFDIALLEKLTSSAVAHEKCIVRGDGICRFRFNEKKKT